MNTANITASKTIHPVTANSKVSAVLLLLPLFVVTMSWAQQPGFTKLNPPGSTYAFAFGINDKGTVTGSFTDAKGVYKGFSYKAGKYTTIIFPGASKTFTQANGINDSNTIVGDFIGKDQLTHGFVLSSGKFTRYDAQKGVSNWISGISKTGSLVGYAGNQGNNQGFVKVGKKVTLFTFQGNATYANGINAANASVGYFIPPPFTAVHGFYRAANGDLTQIDFPGSQATDCLGINDSNEITGLYLDSQGVPHGFTRKNGEFHSYPVPDIGGMNKWGTYVGSYTAKNGKNYGYIVKP